MKRNREVCPIGSIVTTGSAEVDADLAIGNAWVQDVQRRKEYQAWIEASG